MRTAAGLALLLSACASAPPQPGQGPTGAPEPTPSGTSVAGNPFRTCGMPGEKQEPILDATRRRVQQTVCGAALWFDGLFGESDVAAARSARGRVEVFSAHSEFEGADTRVRFSAQARLPALQERLSAFVGRDNQDDVARDRSEGLGLRSQADELQQVEDWFAGLAYSLRDAYGLRSKVRVGVRGIGPTTVFVQLRTRMIAYEDEVNLVQLRATPFYDNLERAGFTGSTDFDHALGPTRLLRWGSIMTVTQETPGTTWRSAFVLYQALHGYRAIAGETFIRGASAAPEPLTEYGVRAIYRQPMFRARLFGELVLGYSWPRVDPTLPREGSAGITFGLEMPFGSTPPRRPMPANPAEPGPSKQ